MKEYEVSYRELFNKESNLYGSKIEVDKFIAKNEAQALLHINHNYIKTNRKIVDIKSKPISGKTLSKFKTCELTEELVKREAVQHIRVDPYVPIKVKVGGKTIKTEIDGGPCHIFVVYD